MEEVIHVGGESGAGKMHLITNFENKVEAAIKLFDISGKKYGIYKGTQEEKQWPGFLEKITEATEPIIIHRWQIGSKKLCKFIHERYPDAKQRMIWVCRNSCDHLIDLLKRCKKRKSRKYYEKWSILTIENNWNERFEYMKMIEKEYGVKVQVVDGGTDTYEIVDNYGNEHPLQFAK